MQTLFGPMHLLRTKSAAAKVEAQLE